MARPLRIEYEGALYHVTSRGNEKKTIFANEAERLLFLMHLGRTINRMQWRCHAYCLMGNHYHLVIETPKANLSRGMRHLNGCYTQSVNRRRQRVGHLFQGRFKAVVIERERYLLEVLRYVVRNPVRAGLVPSPGDWTWSSYRATAGDTGAPDWLTCDWVLLQFATARRQAQKEYRAFVGAGGEEEIWGNLRQQVILGSEAFAEKIEAHTSNTGDLLEIPQKQRRLPPPPLEEYFSEGDDIKRAMARAHLVGGYSLSAVARACGVHYSTVSRAVKRLESEED